MPDNIEFVDKPIYDNVQGFVRVTKCEMEIINSPFFQRLREIRQLGFASYVFPGATHNRLSHSIGVLAIVGKIIRNLKRCNESVDHRDEKVLRMAALLHDIGHYPFSHTVEAAYKTCHRDIQAYLAAEDEQNQEMVIRPELDSKRAILQGTTGHHEELGSYIIRNTNFDGGITKILLQNDFSPSDIADIAGTICGNCFITWYNQILHSELDADRIDYLLRDSHATGVNYGHFDVEYLINNCRLIKDTERNDQLTFGVRESALFAVEHFLLARYFWYAQIVHDRTICIFDEMAKKIFIWLINNKCAYDYTDVLNLINNPMKFIRFTDRYFWEMLDKLIDEQIPVPSGKEAEYVYYKTLAELLVERKPLRKIDVILDKKLSYTERDLDCDKSSDRCLTEAQCPKSKPCPKRALSVEAELKEYEEKLSQIQLDVTTLGEEEKWAIGTFGSVAVSKNYMSIEGLEAERDPIRILEKKQDESIVVRMLSSQKHSIIPDLSERKLVIPRVYVKEELYDQVIATIESRASNH